MTDTDCKEDEVLKRMLKTPPKKNKPVGKKENKALGQADGDRSSSSSRGDRSS